MTPELTPEPEDILDLKGLKCPLPVLKSRKHLSRMAAGSQLTIETTDPLAIIDIPHFCREDGYTLLSSEASGSGHRFVIGKPDQMPNR
ncbi:sulfurtransferase TusA family protein [Agrobacterium vitis]|uniref:sulfurtransferase TusA family protein n=1 Tax=Agrobacterium vitis TaxID=373 RepID=UPI001F1D9687|nr:sulfurtransferase TusA family protein [Agrobacterium vitis]